MPLLVLLIIIPSIMMLSPTSKRLDFVESQKNTSSISPKVSNNEQDNNPDAYFPNFLYYSISVANALIDYLYDNDSGGFFRSVNQFWSNNSINMLKYSYDQAQAILALLKLSDAVINDSERDFAIHFAELIGNYMITRLYDNEVGGFYTSTSSSYKKPGVNGKVIQSLLSLYKTTGNISYRDKAIETFEFIDNFGWDSESGGYVYLLSHSGLIASSNPSSADPYDPNSKKVDHNAIMGEALLELYLLTSDPSYISKATELYQLINTSSRDYTTELFYIGFNNGGIVEPDYTDIFINSLMLEFLSQLYNITGDLTYFYDFQSLINAVLLNFWDSSNGGFFATFPYNSQVEKDEKKYTERQFYAIRALDEAYKLTNNNLYYNLILDVMEFLNNNLYDNVHEGYYLLANADGTEGEQNWKDKYSVTQSLAIYELANLWLYSKPSVLNALWSPLNPRPSDAVTIRIAAFDADGLSTVLLNYSMNNQPYKLIEMTTNELIGNMYDFTFDSQPHGTTVNFNIIVNDTLGNIVVRESYFFVWENDILPPHIMLLGINPSNEIFVSSNFSITVSVHDNPPQGDVTSVRMYYKETGQSKWASRALFRLGDYLWRIEFPDGFKKPNRYEYFFEAIDNRGNFGFSPYFYLEVYGHPKNFPLTAFIGGLFFILFIVPAGIIVYKEYSKNSARTTLRNIKKTRNVKRRKKRGTRRIT
ncbi:MAG: AGE family epimerase/isomerase [Promethearchaeota archaeon]